MTDLIYFCRTQSLFNVEELLSELSAAGINQLVLAGYFAGHSLREHSTADELQPLFDSYGITTPAIHGLFRNQFDLNSDDPEFLISAHTQLLNNCAGLGVKSYVVHSGLPVAGRSRDDEWYHIRHALEALLPVAEQNRVIIAVENLPPEYLGSDPDDLVTLVEAFNSEHLRLCFDSGHAHMCGDATDCLKRMSPYVVTMHLHDNDGMSDNHLTPGDGTLDWDVLVPEIHRCPNLIHMEMEPFNPEGRSHNDMWALYNRVLFS